MRIKKRLLYVAYHYPPIQGSSGVHRTLAFTRYLSEQGWAVTLLTTSLSAYADWHPQQADYIPKGVRVLRAWAWDAVRQLSFRGKYLSWMALPDRWQSWIPFAVIRGWWAIRRERIPVVISTYPIASAHIIGYLLHKLTGAAWIADLRDPMAQDCFPKDARLKRVFYWIESKMVKHCQRILVTTHGTLELYRERYPEKPDSFWQLIPNGYDEVLIDPLMADSAETQAVNSTFTLLHSGTINTYDRHPGHLFDAIAQLQTEKNPAITRLKVVLRGTGMDSYWQEQIRQLKITNIVEVQPLLPVKQALLEMKQASALLILQDVSCNYQIPAKTYEYIRLKRPILALTDEKGDTATLLNLVGGSVVVPLTDTSAIKQALLALLSPNCVFRFLSDDELKQYSRGHQGETLSALLTRVVSE
ncbi:glycosyltransferase [Bowmanella sp. Y26]|uniref:glycosyltransferase n=1 Tax=Bowmanella yangjiangensis TaxID=2811230 RepID=UPI001BDBD14A|nr:glycosyltransferase [Bowmanella yangjiangensis]